MSEHHLPPLPPDDIHATPRWTPLDALGLFSRGLAMGAADIIPGVSGGTIAFISGIYERFIAALRSLSPAFLAHLIAGRPRDAARDLRRIHWPFLIPLFAGIVIAIIAMSGLIHGLMENHPGPTYAFFFGLILATTWIPFARMQRREPRHFVAMAIFVVGAFLFVGLRPEGAELRVARVDPGASTAFYAGKVRLEKDVDAARAALATLDSAASVRTLILFDPKGVLADSAPESTADLTIEIIPTEEALETWAATSPPLILLEERRASLVWIF
ncbi:MAG: DUF368 domain-containing protein, partial [Planctomycetota bacterium]|nr:DUF368 domain-containing protein [Planctomycetota bacterium]